LRTCTFNTELAQVSPLLWLNYKEGLRWRKFGSLALCASYTCAILKWMLWMMERAGRKNGNNKDWHPNGYRDWQQQNKPLEIMSQQMFDEKLAYIHQNPVQAGFVTREEDWKYSSARDFCGIKGLVTLSYS
jgi:hypothetical protein